MCYLLQPNISRDPETIQVNESIISLLLKLHSQLAGTQNSYRPDNPSNNSFPDWSSDSRIGDGQFFVAKLLWRISALDALCRYLPPDFIL
jgi:E3 ubiquitin-protein ligase UBR3